MHFGLPLQAPCSALPPGFLGSEPRSAILRESGAQEQLKNNTMSDANKSLFASDWKTANRDTIGIYKI